ncbi:hypothetical protein N1030_13745 [Desulfovibrio mangrovi]|uniref:cytidylyltransferase domain-containing protein n=1 Tax=Desulfovibrio mangrovi TaxID=2976983 RepID=UPI002246F547|nr:hypothetical protein [Desulfovibrio mangrovi]UZP66663.1 hypothetical protein N1030_13745 [Desulfovibrio mangrovi]
MINVLAIIPARGGSKGVPRKNLRPLAGKPLIYYAITSCLAARNIAKVVVSTDDEEIALFAQRFGAEVLMRPAELAGDDIPLDPVIVHAAQQFSVDEAYSAVVTVQPTSPLISAADIDSALTVMHELQADTLLSVVEDAHLEWTIVADGMPKPLYKERVNRQFLPPKYKETGAVIACNWQQLMTGTRIGKNVALYKMPPERAIDIDSVLDFYICESLLRQKRIVFVVAGDKKIGLGHAYRATLLAHELVHHQICFVCEEDQREAIQVIEKSNYTVFSVAKGHILDKIAELSPELVVNDILDTDVSYIKALKALGAKVICFEDLGSGAGEADLVVNALYPTVLPANNVLSGSKWFCLRDEFIYSPHKSGACEGGKRFLLTFGGVDEGNIACRVLTLLADEILSREYDIDVVLGPGFGHRDEVDRIVRHNSARINVVQGTTQISEFMFNATAAITSGGRTVYELISTKTPTIVICQNAREVTHTAASSENGIINLGHNVLVSDQMIRDAVLTVLDSDEIRQTMRQKMAKLDLKNGKQAVLNEFERLLRG